MEALNEIINDPNILLYVNPNAIMPGDTDSLNEKDESNNAQFSWVESVLVNAMQNGEWLLIEDANRCNPSVLDRLNGLLEENGILEIGEKGCADNGKVSFT